MAHEIFRPLTELSSSLVEIAIAASDCSEELTPERREELRQEAIDAINGLGSRLFTCTVIPQSWSEAAYLRGLWKHTVLVYTFINDRRVPLEVRFHAR